MSDLPIYLDYNATTPVDERVLEKMLPFFRTQFGNAASIQHIYGWDAEEAVDHAREQIARLIGAKSKDIVFTSGATEAINLAIRGVVDWKEGDHLVTCKTEHKAVLDTCEYLERLGVNITYVGVNKSGLIDLDELKSSISGQTKMISIMYANNETGVLQPVLEISHICKARGILFFSDMTQAVGKIPCDFNELEIDLAAFSSHKLYGPKGVGALFTKGHSVQPMILGGGHENGIRSGTLNVPGIVGFGKACDLAGKEMKDEGERLKGLRDELENELLKITGVKVNGSNASRLPHVSNISFEQIDGSKLVRTLKGLAVSQGSACNSAVIEPSHVLTAIGHSSELAHSSIRFSLGRFTTTLEIEKTTKIVKAAVEKLRMQIQ